MIFFRFPGVLPFIACLLALGCDKTPAENEAKFPPDSETARIEGELRLINLSRDARTYSRTFGDENPFIKSQGAPAPITQVHEKSFCVIPMAHHPRLILVGKIRVEVCREPEDHNLKDSAPKMSNEMSQNPASYPQ